MIGTRLNVRCTREKIYRRIDKMATYTRNVVTTVAYLIGIRKSILQNTYADEIENLELLFSDKNATVIRYLCKLRTALMMNFKKNGYGDEVQSDEY